MSEEIKEPSAGLFISTIGGFSSAPSPEETIKNMDNKIWNYDIQQSVFFISAGLILAGVIFTIAAGDSAEKLFSGIKGWMTQYTGWFLVLTMNLVLATCIGIMVSPLGRLRIGGADAIDDVGPFQQQRDSGDRLLKPRLGI